QGKNWAQVGAECQTGGRLVWASISLFLSCCACAGRGSGALPPRGGGRTQPSGAPCWWALLALSGRGAPLAASCTQQRKGHRSVGFGQCTSCTYCCATGRKCYIAFCDAALDLWDGSGSAMNHLRLRFFGGRSPAMSLALPDGDCKQRACSKEVLL
ncbi:unnamed protein product, partial [Ixodes pacificus]